MKPATTILGFLFILSFFIVTTESVSAQSFGINTDASITISPNYPEPNTEVTAKLDAYAINTAGASISWYIDGTEVAESKNLREITLQVGDLGEATKVRARITTPSGAVTSTSRTITPTRVDIIVEADTLVPLHYKGRALPSSGSTVRVIALPETNTPSSQLSYTWILDNKVLYGGSLIGKNTASFEAPKRPSVFLTLEVGDARGIALTRKSILIEIAEPEVYFYEDNALRGLSRNTLRNPHTLVGDEMTVRAEPYYMSTDIFGSDPLIEWGINNSSVENPSNDPQVITLRGGGGTGSFSVDFHIRNLTNLLQGVESGFTIAF